MLCRRDKYTHWLHAYAMQMLGIFQRLKRSHAIFDPCNELQNSYLCLDRIFQSITSRRSGCADFRSRALHQFLLHSVECLDVLDFPLECLGSREAHDEQTKAVPVHDIAVVCLAVLLVDRFLFTEQFRGMRKIEHTLYQPINSAHDISVFLAKVLRDLAAIHNYLITHNLYQIAHDNYLHPIQIQHAGIFPLYKAEKINPSDVLRQFSPHFAEKVSSSSYGH